VSSDHQQQQHHHHRHSTFLRRGRLPSTMVAAACTTTTPNKSSNRTMESAEWVFLFYFYGCLFRNGFSSDCKLIFQMIYGKLIHFLII
jgi:hypothetical protein